MLFFFSLSLLKTGLSHTEGTPSREVKCVAKNVLFVTTRIGFARDVPLPGYCCWRKVSLDSAITWGPKRLWLILSGDNWYSAKTAKNS